MSPSEEKEFELYEDQHTGRIRLPNYNLIVQLNKAGASTVPVKQKGNLEIDCRHGKQEYALMREISESLLEIEGVKEASKRSQLYDLGFSVHYQKFFRRVRSDEVVKDINNILREAAKLKRLDEICNNGRSLTKKVEIRAELELLGKKARQYYGRESSHSQNIPDHKLASGSLIQFQNDVFEKMINTYDKAELKTLCFQIGLHDDELRGESRSEIAREVIKIMERLGRLQLLVDKLRETRPNVDWPDP